MKKKHIILTFLAIFLTFVWLNNTSLFLPKATEYHFLAHRGLAQTYDMTNLAWDTNTAQIIHEPEHPYLENTIPSMQAAYAYGADIVELDVQLTKDYKLAVFHDYDLSMRTDGAGSFKDWNMADLKTLDIGYGYTADNHQTYPFRGLGVGLMPELGEVLAAFPDKELLIHVNHGDLATAKVLWNYLADMSPERMKQITVYGDETALQYLREQNSELRVLSLSRLKQALLKYELLGWTGYIPEEIHNMELHIPLQYAKFLWGWPNKFVNRMNSVNTRVVIVQGDGKWSEGFDTAKSLQQIPRGYTGYIWSNRIDLVTQK